MRSTFYGLDVANKGLFVSQRQIDVTAHNVANVDTEGYSRQRYVTANIPPVYGVARWAPTRAGLTGLGVKTLSLDQIRDVFLDRQYRQENAKASYWEARSQAMYYIEDVFSGSEANRLDNVLSNFFDSVQELSKNPTDAAIRTNVVETAKLMTDMMHEYYNQLNDLMVSQDKMLVTEVSRVNQITANIASLNESIVRFEMSGNVANDLRDARNLLLDELSGLMDITYEEVGVGTKNAQGQELTTVNIKIGGEYLVEHKDARVIEAVQDKANDVTADYPAPYDMEDRMHSIRFADTGEELAIGGGRLQAYMDVRDGNTKENQGIPYFLSEMNKLVTALVETFNEVHMQGWTVPYTDENGIYHPSTNDNVPFFDTTGLTCASISLSEEVLASGFNIAASSEEVIMDADGHFETGNNEIAQKLISMVKERKDLPVVGSLEGFYKSFLGEMASEVNRTNQMEQSELVLIDSLQSQRISVSGVSIDEEMTNLIAFERAYQAAARMITAMDEALEVLIMRTGKVGL